VFHAVTEQASAANVLPVRCRDYLRQRPNYGPYWRFVSCTNSDVAACQRPNRPLGGRAFFFNGFRTVEFSYLCQGSRNLPGGCEILFFGYEREYERRQMGARHTRRVELTSMTELFAKRFE
jgi:hypothetical protein